MSDPDTDVWATIDAALPLLGAGDASSACKDLAQHLASAGELLEIPDAGDGPELVCVDGAVASEQTDTLVWIAAVATSSRRDAVRRKTAVAPVSSSTDLLKSAVMALCEMSMARQVCDEVGEAWMDGGLVTPLMSLSAALAIPDPATSAQLCDVLDAVDGAGIVEDYVHFALQGGLSALPKQDTATSYCEAWAGDDGLSHTTRNWVARQRDRTVAGLVVPPGQFLTARHGVEALRVEASPSRRGDSRAAQWAHRIDTLLGQWRSWVQPRVLYCSPADGLPGRAIKVEFTYAGGDERELAGRRATQASTGVAGTRVLEPIEQYWVDAYAKSEVQGLLAELVSAATDRLATEHPSAVRHYRT